MKIAERSMSLVAPGELRITRQARWIVTLEFLKTSLRLSWSPLGAPETSRASKSDAQSSCGQMSLWFWAVHNSFRALNMSFEQLLEHLTHLIIKHHKQFIYQVYSTSKQLSILNNLITKKLINLSNSPSKLITPLLLPLLGYWSGGMRGAVGIIIAIVIVIEIVIVIII